MLNFLLEGAADTGTGGQGNDLIYSLILLAIFAVAVYFLMIRPKKKDQNTRMQMWDSLAVGDEVTTVGGIIGKVVSVKGETFVLETTKDKTKIRFLKTAVSSIDVKAADLAAAAIEAKTADTNADVQPDDNDSLDFAPENDESNN